MRQARTRHDDSVAVQPASTSTTAARLDVQRGDRPASSITLDSAICCVIDVETTGVDLAVDRIVELAVVRCDAHGQVLDEWHTLIDPQCAMGAEWVHGIDDGMVAGAPTFADVAPRLLQSLDGAVLVAHNASFDHRFVSAELRGAGYDVALPYLCTMHVRRHVGLPAPVTHRLAWACWHAGQPIDHAHAAVSDARATAALMGGYLRLARGVGHATLERLAATAAAANACVEPVLRVSGGTSQGQLRPRKLTGAASPFARSPAVDAAARYRQAVEEAVEDLQIDGEEVDRLHALVLELGLCAEQIAEAHRQFVEGRLEGYLDDEELSWEEYEQLRLLARLLAVDPLWLVDLVGDRAAAASRSRPRRGRARRYLGRPARRRLERHGPAHRSAECLLHRPLRGLPDDARGGAAAGHGRRHACAPGRQRQARPARLPGPSRRHGQVAQGRSAGDRRHRPARLPSACGRHDTHARSHGDGARGGRRSSSGPCCRLGASQASCRAGGRHGAGSSAPGRRRW